MREENVELCLLNFFINLFKTQLRTGYTKAFFLEDKQYQ